MPNQLISMNFTAFGPGLIEFTYENVNSINYTDAPSSNFTSNFSVEAQKFTKFLQNFTTLAHPKACWCV